jgi:glycosyltransferase involved in cell wall biosynthesis
VRTLSAMTNELRKIGVAVDFLTPEGMRTVALPSYPEIRIAMPFCRQIEKRIADAGPGAVHIATEGPIGHSVRSHCLRHNRPFTTSFHTRLAEYAAARWPIPEALTWRWLRWFHNAGSATMAATPSLAGELQRRGFRNVVPWPRGVETGLFRPRPGGDLGLPRPIFLSVGRLAVEKNVQAFLSLDLPGTKVVVGNGPAYADLVRRFPDAVFLGERSGDELASIYASADVFVFPSRTDTFGLVLLEALASGLPVAGFPVAATRDVVGEAPVAILDEDLRTACLQALQLSRPMCRAYAEMMTWEASARHFLANLASAGARRGSSKAAGFASYPARPI